MANKEKTSLARLKQRIADLEARPVNLSPDTIKALAKEVAAQIVTLLFGAEVPEVPKQANGRKRLPFNSVEFNQLYWKSIQTNSKADKAAVQEYMTTHGLPE